MPCFYLECRGIIRRKPQLNLSNLKFPSQLDLFLLPCWFVLQRQSVWTPSFWIGNILELRSLPLVLLGLGHMAHLGKGYIKSPTGKYLIAGTISSVMQPGIIHDVCRVLNYRFPKHLKWYLKHPPHKHNLCIWFHFIQMYRIASPSSLGQYQGNMKFTVSTQHLFLQILYRESQVCPLIANYL